MSQKPISTRFFVTKEAGAILEVAGADREKLQLHRCPDCGALHIIVRGECFGWCLSCRKGPPKFHSWVVVGADGKTSLRLTDAEFDELRRESKLREN